MSAASSVQLPHDASSTYVVMPIKGLATLEHPLPLVTRHDFVEQPLLGARVVQVVVDHLVAEQRARERTALEPRDRVAQRMREALDIGFVGVPHEGGAELELLLDAVETRGEQRREREVRIRVGTGNPRLRAQRLAVPDDAEAARAVVVAPGERRRRPAAGREALVGVDRRREEDRELGRERALARERVLEDVRLPGERRLAV